MTSVADDNCNFDVFVLSKVRHTSSAWRRDIRDNGTQYNDILHNGAVQNCENAVIKFVILSVRIVSHNAVCCNAMCCYVVCCYAVCCYAVCCYAVCQ